MKYRFFAGIFLLMGFLSSCTKTHPPSEAKMNRQPEAKLKLGDKVMVEIETSLGTITAELDAKKAPQTVANFVEYANSGFYNGTIFHRVKPGFMIQGGGLDAEMNEKSTRDPIPNEASNGLKNDRLTLAMARKRDPNSATAQFFINVVDNSYLDYQSPANPGYAVFGKVVSGADVVDKIAKVPTTTVHMYEDVPVQPVVIKKVTVK